MNLDAFMKYAIWIAVAGILIFGLYLAFKKFGVLP